MANLINSELAQLNPWWVQSELIKKDDKLVEFNFQQYKYWPSFYHSYPLDKDALFTVRGPRRVGKTTLLKLLIQKLLLKEHIQPEAIFYYSLERIADYDKLFNLIKDYLDFARPRTHLRLHMFLDEVTFVDGWVRAIKDMADRGLLKNTVLTLTGSNVLELTASGERLPGRRGEIFQPDINYYPLHFGEFLSVIEPKMLEYSPEGLYQLEFPRLEKLLTDYILTGGFIFNINQYYAKKHIPSFAYELFASWVTGDMFKLNRSEEFTLRLLERVPQHLTSRVSFSRLARETGMASPVTASEYIELLERMFVLLKVPYLSLDQKRPNIKKNIKLYFQDPFILASLVARAEGTLDESFQSAQRYLTPDLMPKLAELLVGSLMKRYFDRRLYYGDSSGKEIDFVGKHGKNWQHFEVKYQKDVLAKDIKLPIILQNQAVTIITQNSFQQKQKLKLVPLSIFCAFPQKYIA